MKEDGKTGYVVQVVEDKFVMRFFFGKHEGC